MNKPRAGIYAAWPLIWVVISAGGCLAGVMADGWASLADNLLRYSLGVGLLVAAVAAFAYSRDMRMYRRLLDDGKAGR